MVALTNIKCAPRFEPRGPPQPSNCVVRHVTRPATLAREWQSCRFGSAANGSLGARSQHVRSYLRNSASTEFRGQQKIAPRAELGVA